MEAAHDVAPSRWGAQHGWPMFHLAALSAPRNLHLLPAEQQRLLQFYTAFGLGLPCTSCRFHYTRGVAANPPDVSTRDALIRWSWAVHNRVNKALGKPEFSFDAAVRQWNSTYGQDFVNGGAHALTPTPLLQSAHAQAVVAVVAGVALGWWLARRNPQAAGLADLVRR
jgi:hypothetical protein